jgi:hypothetical protein
MCQNKTLPAWANVILKRPKGVEPFGPLGGFDRQLMKMKPGGSQLGMNACCF